MIKKIYIPLILIISICFPLKTLSAEENKPKTVSINVMPQMNPLTFINEEGKPDGFFIKLLQAIAKEHSFNIEYHFYNWSEGLQSVKNKKIQLMPAVIRTKERMEFLDYGHEIVKTSWGEVFLHIDSSIESLIDLKKKRIGVMKADQNAANFKKLAADFALNCEFIEVNSQKDIIPLIENKTIDAGIFVSTFKYKSNVVKRSTIVFSPVNLYFATAKNTNKELLKLIDTQLKIWKEDKHSPYYTIINSFFTSTEKHIFPTWAKITLLAFIFLCLSLVFLTITLKYIIAKKTHALAKSQRRLNLAVKATNDGIWDWNIKTGKIYWSARSYEMLKYKNKEFKVTYDLWTTLLHPEDLNKIENVIEKAFKDGKPFSLEMRYKQKDGSWKWILGRGRCVERDKIGTPLRMVGAHTDISERKAAQKILMEKEEQLRSVFDKAPSIMLLVDENCRVISLNNTGQKITHKTEETAIGLFGGDLFNCINASDGKNKCGENTNCGHCTLRTTIIDTFKTKHNFNNIEAYITIKSQDQIIKKLFMMSTVYLYINEKPIVLVNLTDITKQKKAEVDLILAKEKAEEADKLKTSFLASLSHEIRTPMNGILGFASLLKTKNVSPEETEEYIHAIEASGDRMLHIINDLVDISKIESGQINLTKNEISINELLDEIFVFFHPQSLETNIKLTLSKDLPDEISYIKIDRDKIAQVLTNLINNAFKFTEKGKISFGYKQNKKMLDFYVKDTGIGIHESMHMAIFERFRQIENSYESLNEGSGLGLSICKAFVEKHGGEMWLESKENSGATFYFSLPFIHSDKTPEKHDQNKISLPAYTGDLNILIAEDDLISYTLLNKILQKHNFNTLYAANGQDAVDIMEQGKKIDLILMDLKMPELSGIEASKRIKKKYPNVPIIAQSAFNHDYDIQNALKAGCDDFITKPIETDILLSSIKKFI